ncbi:MAG: site-specific integrase [Desulfamplus sp.]|nr:site-specific integrase [Desulfamplus sp.]
MTPTLPKENPFDIPKMPEERTPRYVPPEEDFRKVYAVAEGQDRILLLTLIHLACRRGEVFRLKWDDVNFKDERIRLWTRKRENGTYEYEWLPMTKELRNGLIWWKENCPIQTDYVFVCIENKHFCAEYYGKPFAERRHFMRRLCEKAGVKPFGFHAIRHLSASILYALGDSVSIIQTVLRHKSPTTTERYLKSLGLENVREALEKLSFGSTESLALPE